MTVEVQDNKKKKKKKTTTKTKPAEEAAEAEEEEVEEIDFGSRHSSLARGLEAIDCFVWRQ
jgi:hypothetical protein